MTIEKLISLPEPLPETFSQLDPATIQHADEITNARRTNHELRDQWFWTADCALYAVEDNQPILYLTRGKDNPIFKNIKEATEQLIRDRNYTTKKEDLETAINSESTLKAKLSDLNLRSLDGEWSYFEIDTKKYDQLNPEQRKVAERAYGQGNDFQENMKMFKKAGIDTTPVYVLTPSYVKKHAEKDDAITWAGRLYGFDGGSGFGAGGGDVDYSFYHARGVPVSAEGTAQKFPAELEEIKTSLDTGSPFESGT